MSINYDSRQEEVDVMERLLAAHPALTHRDELDAEVRDPVAVADALERLERVGLIHRAGAYAWATRAAMAAEEVMR